MMGRTIYIEIEYLMGQTGAKSAYLSSLHLCHKNDKSDVFDLSWRYFPTRSRTKGTIGRDIQPMCGRSYSDTDLHTFVTACTSGSWLENAGSDVAPKQGFDPWIVGNVAPGPRMPAAESQDGAEGRGWANVLFRDSFRTWGNFLKNHRKGSSITR